MDFLYDWILWTVKIISLILSWVNWRWDENDSSPQKKQNMACLTGDPSQARTNSGEMTSEISRLNHSATEAAF